MAGADACDLDAQKAKKKDVGANKKPFLSYSRKWQPFLPLPFPSVESCKSVANQSVKHTFLAVD